MSFNEINLVDAITGDGDYTPSGDPYFYTVGRYAMGFYGDMGTAQVEFVFSTEKPNDTLEEVPVSADWTFTEKPPFEEFNFPANAPYIIRVSGSDAATNFGINLHQLPS